MTGFESIAHWIAHLAGKPATSLLAGGLVLAWVVSGPWFGYSDTWQLMINTVTTVLTFLMVFVIQNTQNRDTEAMQLKLDELIRATPGAHTAMLELEELSQSELDARKALYAALARKAREALENGGCDTGTAELEATPPRSA